MTECYETMQDQITAEGQYGYGYKAMHSGIRISDVSSGHAVTVPHESLSIKYREYLKQFICEVELTDNQLRLYRCNPEAMSENLYGTVQHWGLLLELNNCPSRINFTKKKVKYYDPNVLLTAINNILLKEQTI